MEKQVRLNVRVKAITVNGSVETDSGRVVGTFSRDIPSDRLDEVVTVDEPEPEPLAEWERELLSPFPAGLVVSEDGVALNWRGVNYVRQSEPWPTAQWVWHAGRLWEACNDNGTPYYTNAAGDIRDYPAQQFDGPAIPVRPVPVAAFDALVAVLARWNTSFGTEHREVAQFANRLAVATGALGLDA